MSNNQILLCCESNDNAATYQKTLDNIDVEVDRLPRLDLELVKQKTRYTNFTFILWHASKEEIENGNLISRISHDEVAGLIPLVVVIPEDAPNTLRTALYQYGATNIMSAPIHPTELAALASVYISYQQRQRDMTDMIGEVARLSVHLQREIEYRKTIEADLYKASVTDPLTQCLNRRAFIDYGEKEISRFERYQTKFCLAYLDLDHFKQINDNFGHQAGDTVLIQFANLLSKNCRKTDIIGRLGGEEFAVILSETEIKGAAVKMESIRHLVNKTPCRYNQYTIPYTVSIGMCESLKRDNLFDWMLAEADRRLYQAKSEGRNRVIY